MPNDPHQLNKLLDKISGRIKHYQGMFFQEQAELKVKASSNITQNCVPICGDIRKFDYDKLIREQEKNAGRLFDVIMMDPPWQLAGAAPSRGVAIKYQSLLDEVI